MPAKQSYGPNIGKISQILKIAIFS